MNTQNDAAEALETFASGPAMKAADDTARAFEAAGERIAKALEGAARSGEFSFESMAENVAQSLARLAINELLVNPLQDLVAGIGQNALGSASKSLTVNMNPVRGRRSGRVLPLGRANIRRAGPGRGRGPEISLRT